MFRLLGPLVLATGDNEVAPATQKQRQMLAVLLLDANKPVSLDRLTEELWGDNPPRSAVANLRSYASALRTELDRAGLPNDRLATVRNGYLLRVEPGERDLDVVESLATDASAAFGRRDFASAERLLRQALDLWRGATLSGVDLGSALAARVQGIEERRLDLFEDLVETRLRLSDGKSMLIALREHLAAHPLRERAHGQLMRLLYAQGDSAGALQAYQRAREILDAELGLDPGPDLTRLQQAILRREPIVDERPATVTVPRQLPPDVPGLVGRDDSLAALRASRAGVRAVHGQGGVGKSALVIRLAHELAEEYPDGQLYVDLQGSNPRLTPLAPAEVLGRFIRALSPSFPDVPVDTAEAAGLFRSLVADRRVLVILDNAIDAAHLRSLLPGSSSCLALVTSRRALTAIEDADHLALDVLAGDAALALLAPIASTDPDGARRLVEICGGLPLALRILAARLTARPDWAVGDVVARLTDARRRLDELQAGDLEVRASIDASYRALDPVTARAFRIAGFIRVPRLSGSVLSAALGVPVAAATVMADALVEARLIDAAGPGYRLHDLVRLFAAERALAEDSAEERGLAIHRVCGHYLVGARQAVEMQYGYLAPMGFAWSAVRDPDLRIDTTADALRWLEDEWESAVAMAEQAVENGPSRSYPAELARSMTHYLTRRFQYTVLRNLSEMALAHSQPEDSWRTNALMAMATVERRVGDLAEAGDRYREVIRIREETGDLAGLSAAWNGLALLEKFCGRSAEALQAFLRCREVMRRSGNLQMESYLLANMAEIYAEQDQHREAIDVLTEAVRVARPPVAVGFKLVALDALGRMHAELGDYARALSCQRRSLVLNEDVRDEQVRRTVLLSRAATLLRLNRADLAVDDIAIVREESLIADDVYRHAAAVRLRAQASRAMGDSSRAHQEMRSAELLFRRLDQPYERHVEKFLAGGDPTLPRPGH